MTMTLGADPQVDLESLAGCGKRRPQPIAMANVQQQIRPHGLNSVRLAAVTASCHALGLDQRLASCRIRVEISGSAGLIERLAARGLKPHRWPPRLPTSAP